MGERGSLAIITFAVIALLATAGAALAADSSPLYLKPALAIIALAVVLAGFIFLVAGRRQKAFVPEAKDIILDAEGSAYAIIHTHDNHFTAAPNLHTLVKRVKPVKQFEQLSQAFSPEGMRQLEQAVELCRQGRPTSALVLPLSGNDGCLECRLFAQSGGDKGEIRSVVIWFFDIGEQQRARTQMEQENEKLKNDLRQYSTILNMSPYPIWQRDGDLNICFYNLAYSEAVEDAPDKADGEAPEIDKRMRVLARMARESGKPVSERRHVVIGGERRLYHIAEFPLRQENISVGFAVDMTEVEQLKEELSRHISAQADLLESSASAMAIYGADMRLKSFNYAFVSLWKFDEVWLDTQPTYGEILEALREKRKLPEQANFHLFKQQQVKLFTDLIAPREEFFYLPDGKALRVIAIPHALGGILFAYEDVTDRLALERSYNTLIAVQRETLDNLHEGVAVFGEDGCLKLSNPGYLHLWRIDEELARSEPHITEIVERCKDLFIYDDWESFKNAHIEHIQLRDFKAKRLERSDGKMIDWRKVPLPDGATLITHLDVTDSTLVERSLRERNEALQAADRLKSEFLANVSYELRSPLTSISGFSEMLRQEYFGALGEKQKEYVDGIHQSSQHLMQLINDILDLASVEAGYMRLEVTKFDIHAMMKSVLSLTQERIKEFNLSVTFDCPAKIGKMVGDEVRIKQILFNLLSNAIKYSPSGGAIALGARETDSDEIMLWVEDQGQGIAPAEQEAVFGKFYKGKNQEKAKGKPGRPSGTGLGLSIVKSFVDLHGGHVELHSEVGKGTRFECFLMRHNPNLEQYMKPRKAA